MLWCRIRDFSQINLKNVNQENVLAALDLNAPHPAHFHPLSLPHLLQALCALLLFNQFSAAAAKKIVQSAPCALHSRFKIHNIKRVRGARSLIHCCNFPINDQKRFIFSRHRMLCG